MLTPNKFEEQVIFYCKLWFESPNKDEEIVEGMKTIIGKYFWLEPEHVNEHDVYRHLLDITFKYVPQKQFQETLQNLYKFRGDTINIQQFIRQLFGLIQGLRIQKDNGDILIQMTQPDYSVLPKRTTPVFSK